jgi:hypothetical protein
MVLRYAVTLHVCIHLTIALYCCDVTLRGCVTAFDADLSRYVNISGHDNCAHLGYCAASSDTSRRMPEVAGHVLYEILTL